MSYINAERHGTATDISYIGCARAMGRSPSGHHITDASLILSDHSLEPQACCCSLLTADTHMPSEVLAEEAAIATLPKERLLNLCPDSPLLSPACLVLA